MGDALWITHILKRVPETPGSRGLHWALVLCFGGQSVGLNRLLVCRIVMGGGREGETDLRFLTWTSSRKWCGDEEER